MNTSLFKPEAGGSIVVTVSLIRVYTLSLAFGRSQSLESQVHLRETSTLTSALNYASDRLRSPPPLEGWVLRLIPRPSTLRSGS
jgi:hypothetical protein